MRIPLTAAPLRAVLYDHDGTLVDSLAVVVAATNAVLHAHGLPPETPERVIAGMVEPTAPRMGLHAGVEDREGQRRLALEYYATARRLGAAHVRVYPGIAAALAHLAGRGLAQGVVSNNEGAFVRMVVDHLGLAPHLAVTLGEEDIPAPKPDPRGLVLAARRLGLAPEHCIYVGDSPGDAVAARGAGMAAIGCTWGTHRRHELAERGFAALIDHPDELLALATSG